MNGKSSSRGVNLSAWILLAVATLSQIGVSIAQQGVGVLAYAFLDRYHLSLAGAGTLVTVTSLGMVTSMLIGGRLVDLRGPRPVLMGSAVLSALAALLVGRTTTTLQLDAALYLLGLALGAAPIAGARAIFVRFEGRLRGTAMGIRQNGVTLGAAVAAGLLPPIAGRLGPSAVFPQLAIELLVLGGAFAWLVRPVRASSPGAAPAVRGSLRPLLLPAAVGFLLVAGQYDLLAFTIDHLRTLGIPLWAAALALTASQLGGSAGRIGFGFVSDRVGSRPRTIALAAALGAIGVGVAGLLPGTTPLPLIVGVFALAGAGAIGWNALVLTWGAERVGAQRSGTAIGLLGAAIFFGSAAFPPLFGFAVSALHGYAGAYLLLALQLLLAAALALFGARRKGGVAGNPA